MHIQVLAFAHLADTLGFRQKVMDCAPEETPRELLTRLAPSFDPTTVRVALDEEYRSWDEPIGAAREIALIPPVSGG